MAANEQLATTSITAYTWGMNRGLILVVLLGISLSVGLWPLARPYFPTNWSGIKNALPTKPTESQNQEFFLRGPNLQTAGMLPQPYTCEGRGISPELDLGGIPSGTKSIAISMVDIDVPSMSNGKFYHWGMWSIDPSTTHIPSNSLPSGAILGINSAKTLGYTPPCPPSGEHRYIITAYAVRSVPTTTKLTVEKFLSSIGPDILSSASIVTRYRR